MTRARLLLALAVIVLGAAGAARTASGPRTIAVIPGEIAAFAYEGDAVAWGRRRDDRDPGCDLWTRDVDSGRARPVGRTWACHGMDFDGRRIVLLQTTSGTYSFGWAFHAHEAGRDPVVLGGGHEALSTPATSTVRAAYAAADGRVAFFQMCDGGDDCGTRRRAGVYRPGRRAPVVASRDVSGVALSGGVLATAHQRVRRFTCGCVHGAEWSPDGRRIAFARGESIAVVGADGKDLRTYDPTELAERSPRWLPDGVRLLVALHPTGNDPVRHAILDLRDGSVRDVASPEGLPSPGGARVATIHEEGERREVRVVDVATGATRTVLGVEGVVFDVDWAPDGRRLAVASVSGLYVVSLDGHAARVLPGAVSVDWAPDGTRLLLGLYNPDDPDLGGSGIDVINADGTGRRSLVRGGVWGAEPTWSPDGSRILFVGDRRWERHWELFVANADGSGIRSVFDAAGPELQGLITLYDLAGARRLAEARYPRTAWREIALGGRLGAALAEHGRLELFDPRAGSPLRTVRVRTNASHLGVAGRTAVYVAGRTIFGVDAATGETHVLARTPVPPVGLSTSGRRVAWAEPGERASRIRVLDLAR